MGSEQSEFDVIHPLNPAHLRENPMANIMDHKPLINIKPFGQCKSLANPAVAAATAANSGNLQKMPCIPSTTSPWLQGKNDVLIKGQPALTDNCKCVCAWAGEIVIKQY